MKHTLRITIILVFAFFLAQTVGLAVTNEYIDHQETEEIGELSYKPLPFDIPRPEIEGTGGAAVVWMGVAILIGTLLIFLIMKFGSILLWKIWFLIAITTCLTVAFAAFTPKLFTGLPASVTAAILALTLGILKIFRPRIIIQNITEIFVYGGLATIFIKLFSNPQLGVFWAFVLLLLISVYDMIAVWKSKHMITLAKFQTEAKIFAGLLIPYRKVPRPVKNQAEKKVKVKTAILGGGDIGFPLIFGAAVMQNLMLINPEWIGFLKGLIIPIFASIALLFLLVKSQKDKFYPAMPFLTIGCIAGYVVLFIVNVFI